MPDIGGNIGEWLLTQAQSLALGIIAIIVVYYLGVRQMAGLMKYVVLSIVCLAFIFAGDSLIVWAVKLWNGILG